MTQRYGFFDSVDGDRRYSAEDMGRMFDGIIRDGIFANYMEAFKVSPHNGLSVRIAPGRCWFNHRWFECDETIYLGLAAAHTTYARIDAVAIEVNEDASTRSVRLRIITGAPSSAPAVPTGIHQDGLNQYIVATIQVKANATAIDATNIVDNRGGTSCPWVTAPDVSIDLAAVMTDIRAKWNSWFDTIQDAALNPPNANVELAAVKQDIAAIKRDWDISKMKNGTPDSSSTLPFINGQFETRTMSMLDLGFASFASRPEIHNQIFRGKHLGDRMTNAQQQAIKTGSFDDLWLGDYWVRNNVRYTIAGFNYWLGQAGITNSHVVILARGLFDSVKFSTGNMTDVRTTYIISNVVNVTALNRFVDVFGSDKIMSRPHNYVNHFDGSGVPDNVATDSVKMSLMQPGMLSTAGVGAIIRSNYTINNFNDTMILPLFLAKPDWRNTTSNHWLNYVFSNGHAAVISTIGAISAVNVTSTAACYPIAAVMG